MQAMETLFDNLKNKAAEYAPIVPEDYVGEDGLIYCGKCHTKKQFRGSFFGEVKVVPCICHCEYAAKEAEQELKRQEEFAKSVKNIRSAGFPESAMETWTFANDDNANPRIMQAMKNYAEKFEEFKEEGKGLLLYGDVGTGKTYAAACITNRLIDKGHPCLMTNFARLINTIWGMDKGKQEYLDRLNRFDLLVLDDLGAERKSEYAQEQVFNIIDGRYRAKKPLIITTNLSMDEIKKPQDPNNRRIYDRILEMCHPIEVTGVSRRRQKVKKEYADMNTRLGL